MKKRLLSMALVAVMAVWMIACDKSESNAKTQSMFGYVEFGSNYEIVYHKETKVMYAISDGSYNHGTFTLLVNPDGTPMLYESED